MASLHSYMQKSVEKFITQIFNELQEIHFIHSDKHRKRPVYAVNEVGKEEKIK